jgi:PPOX class probable F420-dependent enzyme
MPPDPDAVQKVVDATHLAVLATTRADGRVHASLVSAGLIDDPVSGDRSIGAVVAGGARKLEHLRRSGRAAAVFTQGYRWVSVEGPVRIVGPDDTVDGFPAAELPALLRRVFVAAGGSHDDWDAYDRAMAEERRAAVFIQAERTTGNA